MTFFLHLQPPAHGDTYHGSHLDLLIHHLTIPIKTINHVLVHPWATTQRSCLQDYMPCSSWATVIGKRHELQQFNPWIWPTPKKMGMETCVIKGHGKLCDLSAFVSCLCFRVHIHECRLCMYVCICEKICEYVRYKAMSSVAAYTCIVFCTGAPV